MCRIGFPAHAFSRPSISDIVGCGEEDLFFLANAKDPDVGSWPGSPP